MVWSELHVEFSLGVQEREKGETATKMEGL